MTVGKPSSVLILGSGPSSSVRPPSSTMPARSVPRDRAVRCPDDPRSTQPGDDHDRPRVADAVYLELLTVDAVEAVIARERPDRWLAGLGGRRRSTSPPACRRGRARAARGPASRHAARGDPHGGGPGAVPGPARPGSASRTSESYRRGDDARAARRVHRRSARGHRPAGHRAPGVHARWHRRRHRGRRRRSIGAPPRRPARQPHRAGHGRALPRRLAGDRIRGDAGRGRHVHRRRSMENVDPLGVHTGDSIVVRPSRRSATRSTSGSAARRWPSSGRSASRAAATSTSRYRRTRPEMRRHRGQPARFLGRRRWRPRLPATRSPGLPPRSRSAGACRDPERRRRNHGRRLRAGARLRRRQAAALPVRQVRPRTDPSAAR